MTEEALARGNKLRREIRELDMYISHAERVWQGKLRTQHSKTFLSSIAYGAIHSEEILLSTDLKNKVLDVLRQELKELRAELALL